MSTMRLISGILMTTAIYAVLLFVPAWTLHWWQAWVYLAVATVGGAVSTIVLARTGSGILEERFKPPVQRSQPLPDKILTILIIAAFCGTFIISARDVFAWRLLPPPGLALGLVGLLAALAGWTIMTLALRENAFAAPVVRLQAERHQTVVDTGVYSVVRHPMYSGAALYLLGTPLWLQSTAGLLFGIVPLLVMVIRILVEERVLRQGLPGYEDYRRRVRYRLVPHIW